VPQQKTQTVVNTFTKGLITEAGEMTFPPDASVDELNCDLRRDGTRRRREGANIEDGRRGSYFSFSEDEIISTGYWYNVGGNSDKEYTVIQVGHYLRFYEKKEAPFSTHQKTTVFVNLADYEHTGSTGSGGERCSFSSINGLLIVASPAIDTIYVRENPDETITVGRIKFRVRDFQWQSDSAQLVNAVHEDDVTPERIYDTYNAGWVGPKGKEALEAFIRQDTTTEFFDVDGTAGTTELSGRGYYPPLTLPWFSGKKADGTFSVPEWELVATGTSLLGNGHFILDFFEKDRFSVSRVAGLTVERETSRFSTVCSAFSRVFYAGLNSEKNSGVVLFSKTVEAFSTISNPDLGGLGDCLQINDPTSETLSDLLDSDGGVIRIPDAIRIRQLHFFNNAVYVFADNGVWQIRGVDDVFKATAFAVVKISSVGLVNRDSLVSADGVPFWWSDFGIHTLQFDANSLNVVEQNLSITTIQSFFDSIPIMSRATCQSVYDSVNKVIYWMYQDNIPSAPNKYNNFLVLNLPLQAFYPWRLADDDERYYAVGAAFYDGYLFGSDTSQVVDGSGNDVVTATGDNVIVDSAVTMTTGDPTLVLLLRDVRNNQLTMGGFNDETFKDWGSADYSSYAEAGVTFLGDAMARKTTPYFDIYLRRTETGWSGNETTGYDPVRPSSLLVKAFWDFKTTPSSAAQQAYRMKDVPVVDQFNLSEFGATETVLRTRLKIRGSGRAVKFRFESETGKDFVLIGYGYLSGNNRYP
jgi:hypothetical protein